LWVYDPHPETRQPFLAGYWGNSTPHPAAESRLDFYCGLQYLAHVLNCVDWGQPNEAAEYRSRLDRWLEGRSGDR